MTTVEQYPLTDYVRVNTEDASDLPSSVHLNKHSSSSRWKTKGLGNERNLGQSD